MKRACSCSISASASSASKKRWSTTAPPVDSAAPSTIETLPDQKKPLPVQPRTGSLHPEGPRPAPPLDGEGALRMDDALGLAGGARGEEDAAGVGGMDRIGAGEHLRLGDARAMGEEAVPALDRAALQGFQRIAAARHPPSETSRCRKGNRSRTQRARRARSDPRLQPASIAWKSVFSTCCSNSSTEICEAFSM